MNRTIPQTLVVAIASTLIATGCRDSASEAQRKVDEAEATATHETTSAQYEADRKAAKARAEADKKIAEATHDFLTNVEDYRHDVSEKLVDLDKRIADLEAQAKTMTGQARTDLEARLALIRSQREAFARDLEQISGTTATTWDATKKRLDAAWESLRKSVDEAM